MTQDLKKKFEIYDRMKERVGKTKIIGKKEIAKNKTGNVRCFGCGATNHDLANCTHKEKGNVFDVMNLDTFRQSVQNPWKRNKEINIIRIKL